MAKKILVLTPTVIGGGTDALIAAITANIPGAAADIVLIVKENDDALALSAQKLEAALKDLGDFKKQANAELKTANGQIDDLTRKLDEAVKAAGEKERLLNEKYAVLQNLFDEKNEELKGALAVNEGLTKEVERLSVRDTVPQTYKTAAFEIDGKRKAFTHQTMIVDGQRLTWQMVLESKDLQRKLVDRNSGMLRDI